MPKPKAPAVPKDETVVDAVPVVKTSQSYKVFDARWNLVGLVHSSDEAQALATEYKGSYKIVE